MPSRAELTWKGLEVRLWGKEQWALEELSPGFLAGRRRGLAGDRLEGISLNLGLGLLLQGFWEP